MAYVLTNDLKTGNELIDSEHEELFRAVNNLLDACNRGQGKDSIHSMADFLTFYVDKHFTDEQKLQQKYHYPDFVAHLAFHEGYKKDLKGIIDAFPPEGPGIGNLAALNSHIGKLINHIKVDDKKLGQFLKNAG